MFYSQGKQRTCFSLIHADGTALAETVAQEIIDADRQCGGQLHSLRYLAPAIPTQDKIVPQALAHYRQWLAEECGYIQLDGLPADADLSATRLKLERLFVPLKATFVPKKEDHPDVQQTDRDMTLSIGELLAGTPHLALLAMPGGGKSTLLKRLATAYAFPERRREIVDDLPERDWLPLMLRCRELRDRAHRPILELLDDIPRHAGLNTDECGAFGDFIHGALRSGTVLLLVDGLDEISDEGARQTFTNHLRTFIAMFPLAALVITSREAGFRLVASVVAGACEQAKLSPLDEDDVVDLCERWHVEVVGDTPKVRNEAKELGQAIWSNHRIRTLTENPLLLTTLLVVKRCVGELPRSRTTLYREAIRVLVRTWNVEGYAPLDEDETLAQLSYVACAMMVEGKQQIDQKALLKLLQNARRELEAELQFARISPQDFIQRIEYRSSLLMQTGHARIDGELQPVFEFRHLTFQEYLAARGYVEEQYPGREAGRSLSEVLEPHFVEQGWREVIPLAAVLAGRKAEELIKRLIAASESRDLKDFAQDPIGVLLYQCIRDEVQVTAPTLRNALSEISRGRNEHEQNFESDWFIRILRGKFGAIFQEVCEQTYLQGGLRMEQYLDTLKRLALHLQFADTTPEMTEDTAASLAQALNSDNRFSRIKAALVSMWLAYVDGREGDQKPERSYLRNQFQKLVDGLSNMLKPDDLPSALAASWALAWIGQRRFLAKPPSTEMIVSLFRLWTQFPSKQQARYALWASSVQPLLPRDSFNPEVWGNCDALLRDALTSLDWRQHRSGGALVVGWYRRSPWTDLELVELAGQRLDMQPTLRELLQNLGEAGRRTVVEWESKQEQRQRTRARSKRKKS